MKTVPPRWVYPLSSSSLDSVQAHRLDTLNNPAVYPRHHDTTYTQYHYNSLNEPILQISPDADTTQYWYDRVGRVAVSQDGRQRPDSLYSYTRYDALGRTIEVGEKYSATAMDEATARNESSLASWITGGLANTRTQVTYTHYDEAPFSLPSFGPEGQENLHSRVASTTFEAVNNNDADTYDYGTHYSYDATGNVKALIQEIEALHAHGHGYKRIDYSYDFISGKVNAVFYQQDSTDQFTHRYKPPSIPPRGGSLARFSSPFGGGWEGASTSRRPHTNTTCTAPWPGLKPATAKYRA
ncbi:MAG: hypothetical protein KDD02_23260 [Phaeodactylibacter sp.]|nr:hypothetical protein [Phaeodactylibacter sp.]